MAEPERRLQMDFNEEEFVALTTCAMLGVAISQEDVAAAIRVSKKADSAVAKLGAEGWNNLINRLSKGASVAFPTLIQSASKIL